jgi:hypothetical protein
MLREAAAPVKRARSLGDSFTVSGPWYGWRVPALAVALLGGLAALGSVLALRWLNLPWMLPASTVEHPLVAPLAFVFAGAFSYGLVKPFFMARGGRVTLSARRVRAKRRGFRSHASWSDLVGYIDASPATVGLVRRGKTAPDPRLAIPTRTEEARVTALRILDARGLRRVEVAARGRPLGRALVTGLLAVFAFLLVLVPLNASYWELVELNAQTVATDESADLLARLVWVEHATRPVAGTDDAICLRTAFGFHGRPAFVPERHFQIDIACRVEADGVVLATRRRCPFGCEFGSRSLPRGVSYEISCAIPRHALAPGRHTLHVVSDFDLGEIHCEKTAEVPIEVAPGSIAERTVKLVRGAAPVLDVKAVVSREWKGNFLEATASFDLPERALAMDVAIIESGTEFASGWLVAPKGVTGSEWLALIRPSGSGRHVLTFRFTPDVALAFDKDVACTEIHGEPIEKVVVFDAP